MKLCKTIGTCAALKYLGIAICVVGLHAASALRAAAAPVSFGSNFYEFVQVPGPFTGNNNAWATASAAAAASVFNTVSGHLATITSQAENDFLFGLVSGSFAGFAGAWLGGKAPEGWLVGPETGQGFSYTNWGGIEPNNTGFAYMNIGTGFAGIGPGQWADDSMVQGVPDPSFDPVIGYFVEYEGTAAVAEVPVDIKPQTCPNKLNTRSRGKLSVAILGTPNFDVTAVDPASIRLESVSPLRSAFEDVATPFEPFVGKESASDCTDAGPDSLLDLTLKFDTQEVVGALGDVEDGEVRVLRLTGNLLEEFDGTPIQGEDVVVILKKGK